MIRSMPVQDDVSADPPSFVRLDGRFDLDVWFREFAAKGRPIRALRA